MISKFSQASPSQASPLSATSLWFSAVLTVLAFGIIALSYFPSARASSGEIEILRFPHPESGKMVSVTMPRGSDEQIRRHSPRNLRADRHKMRAALEAQCAGRPGPFKELVYDFPAESAAFNLALAASADNQMKGDPAALRHFYEQNLLDPVAHVSFAGFMLANRATASFLSMIHLAYDPCRALRRADSGKPLQMQPSRAQRLFAPLVGPMGMSAGMIASSVIHEIFVDENLHLCAKGLVTEVDPARLEEACDKAYEDWAVSRKISQYAPDIFSMVATSFIQAYAINWPLMKVSAAARRSAVNTLGAAAISAEINGSVIALRSLQVVWRAGSMMSGPWIRFGVMVANVWVFLEINEFILPYVKNPWEQRSQGLEITQAINTLVSEIDRAERNSWVWKEASVPALCSNEPTPMDYAFAIPYRPSECSQEAVGLGKQIKRLGEKGRKWRNFVLSDAFTAHTNWKDYVLQFTNMYANAYAFYKDITYNINWQKVEGSRPGVTPEPLYRKTPFHGVNVQLPPRICDMDHKSKNVFELGLSIAREEISLRESGQRKLRTSDELSLLRSILTGLEAVECARPSDDLNDAVARAISIIEKKGGSVSPAQREQVLDRIRGERFEMAISVLNRVLRGDGPHSDLGHDPRSSAYRRLAEINPFAKIRLVLGNPEPLPEGIAYLRELNSNDSVINQEYKSKHPHLIRNARTDTMTDYLLASMVCGPEAVPTSEMKMTIARDRRKTVVDRVLEAFGLGQTHLLPVSDEEMIAVEHYISDEVNPKPRLFSLPQPFHSDFGLLSKTWGSRVEFRPPRIVDELGVDVCRHRPVNADPQIRIFDVHAAQWMIGAEQYEGLLDIVKKRARSSIIGTDAKSYAFPQWWTANVDIHVRKAVQVFRDQFDRLLEEKFVPKITKADYAEYNGRRFALGAANSLKDDLRFNLLLLAKVHRIKDDRARKDTPQNESVKAQMREITDRINWALDLFGEESQREAAILAIQGATGAVPTAAVKTQKSALRIRTAYETNNKALQKSIESLNGSLNGLNMAGQPSTKGNAANDNSAKENEVSQKNIKEIKEASIANLNALVTELDSLFGVVNTLNMDGLD